MKRDGLVPIERFQRTNHRIVAFQNSVGRAAWPQQEGRVAVKRADFKNVPQPLRKQPETFAGLMQARSVTSKITVKAAEHPGLCAHGFPRSGIFLQRHKFNLVSSSGQITARGCREL